MKGMCANILKLTIVVIIPTPASTELVMFKLRLAWTKFFVVLLAVAIEKDPETINITDPQNEYPMYTDRGFGPRKDSVPHRVIIPMLKIIKPVIICIAPRTLGCPFKNFSFIPFH